MIANFFETNTDTRSAFFLAMIGVLVFLYMLCAIRTNVVFFTIFALLECAAWLLVGAYWKASEGNAAAFSRLSVVWSRHNIRSSTTIRY
jgi:succinate-acetate transporter protein